MTDEICMKMLQVLNDPGESRIKNGTFEGLNVGGKNTEEKYDNNEANYYSLYYRRR